jgi:hypothetical protein
MKKCLEALPKEHVDDTYPSSEPRSDDADASSTPPPQDGFSSQPQDDSSSQPQVGFSSQAQDDGSSQPYSDDTDSSQPRPSAVTSQMVDEAIEKEWVNKSCQMSLYRFKSRNRNI